MYVIGSYTYTGWFVVLRAVFVIGAEYSSSFTQAKLSREVPLRNAKNGITAN